METLSIDPGAPPKVTPSDLTRYLDAHHRPEVFTTSSIASYLHLTAQEAHAALNTYADDNLVAYAGERDGLESWTTTHEGQRVLVYRGPRWTKKSLSSVLAAIAARQIGQDITEVSVAGRALRGAANGTLVIGLRLTRAPYSDVEDLALIRRLLEVINEAAARPGPLAILMFQNVVPHRLRDREVLMGDYSGMTLSTEDVQIDRNEAEHRAALSALLRSLKRPSRPHPPDEDEWASMLGNLSYVHPALHGLQTYFYYEDAGAPYPIDGCRSPLELPHNTAEHLAKAFTDFAWLTNYLRDRYDWTSWQYDQARSMLGAADYHIARGTLSTFVSSLDDDVQWMDRLCSGATERTHVLLAGLTLHYEALAARRERSQATKKKPPGDVHYYAAFDCLNSESPLLVGFVRQPLSHRANLNDVEDHWYHVLRGLGDASIGGMIQKAGMNGVQLSLRYRRATEAEIAAYDHASARLGGTLKFILRNGKGRLARDRYSYIDIGEVPVELSKATWGDLPLTLLVRGRHWHSRGGYSLFDLIRKLPEPHRSRALSRLLDVDEVAMIDFAARAADPDTVDPVVLASGLRDDWSFKANGARWEALLAANTWSVRLEGERNKLSLKLTVDGREHTEQMAPLKKKSAYRRPYGGNLSSLLGLLSHLQELRQHGAEEFIAEYGDGGATDLDLDWYLGVISRILHSFGAFSSSDGTDWPYFERHTTIPSPETV